MTEFNQIFHGDCLLWLQQLPRRSVRLVLIDPPFFTGQDQISDGETRIRYKDTWKGGLQAYLDWLIERLSAMREVLLPDGSLVIHLDWHAIHAVKVELDKLFGAENFQNEIVWYYQTGGATQRRFSRKHDSLLWYTNSGSWKFYPERIRVHRAPKALERARNPKGARVTADAHDKLPGDVIFVPPLNPMSRERCGYPTQKPIELAELFIESMTDPGEVVADFFCGSGTTVVAAALLDRKWLASDLSSDAVRITHQRLAEVERNLPLLGKV